MKNKMSLWSLCKERLKYHGQNCNLIFLAMKSVWSIKIPLKNGVSNLFVGTESPIANVVQNKNSFQNSGSSHTILLYRPTIKEEEEVAVTEGGTMPPQIAIPVKCVTSWAALLIYLIQDTFESSLCEGAFNTSRQTQKQRANQSVMVANLAVATPESIVDPNWYADNGASNHVTANPSFLTRKDSYIGTEQVVVGNGSSMVISHVENSTIPSKYGVLTLNNVLCIPQIAKNLDSVSQLAKDNNVYMEFHSNFYVVKDKFTGVELLKGVSKDGLYQVASSTYINNEVQVICCQSLNGAASSLSHPYVFYSSVMISKSILHKRLGHPSTKILNRVIKDYNLESGIL